MSKPPYASTHAHPQHIDIPDQTSAPGPEPDDLLSSPLTATTPSSARPPAQKGILKNPLRRPSQPVEDGGIIPATDAERVMAIEQ